MRSRLTRRTPAPAAMSSIRPSTYAGTPVIIEPRRGAEALRPVAAHDLVIAADPAGRDDDEQARSSSNSRTTSRLVAAPRGASSSARTTPRRPVTAPPLTRSSSTRCRCQIVSSAAVDRRVRRVDERLDDAGAGAPRDVEARNGVAVPVGAHAAALGPADRRDERDAELLEPRALLSGRPLDVRARPPHRPAVLVVETVEAGAAASSPASASSSES